MLIQLFKILTIFIFIKLNYIGDCSVSSLCNDLKLYSNKLHSNFATKTGYFSVKKDESNWKNFLDKTSKCTKENVWFISRHGTRYPIEEDYVTFSVLPKLVIKIEKNFLEGKGCLEQDDIDKYTGWIPLFEKRDKGELHAQGAEELYSIGKHWASLFPEIYGLPYNSQKIKVQFTTSNRTGQSAYHFLRGMYGEDAAAEIPLPKPKNVDLKLRFHKFCAAWMRDVYRNKNTYVERQLFEKTSFFQATLHAVSARLGFNIPMNKSHLVAMYDECRYETAWYPNSVSIWCKPFTEKDMEVMEFFQDLKYYYEDSYGIDMNYGMACETIADILNKLRTGLNRVKSKRLSTLYFSHDKVLLHIFTSLGLFRPTQPLKHSDFENSTDRVFRTSYVSPFASNLAFALYKCEDGHKIGTFFQGAPMYLKHICPDLLCDWASFENYLLKFLSTCNFTKTCNIHDEL